MHELRSGAQSQPDRMDLVPGDPLNPPSRIDRCLDSIRELAPLRPRETVQEEGQPDIVASGQCPDELACIHLQPAHLAGSKEKQVHPDVHRGHTSPP